MFNLDIVSTARKYILERTKAELEEIKRNYNEPDMDDLLNFTEADERRYGSKESIRTSSKFFKVCYTTKIKRYLLSD